MGNVVKAALGLAALLLSACAVAPGIPDVPPPVFEEKPAEVGAFAACHRESPGEVAVVDQTSQRLQETVCGASLWFDGLFGERDITAARTAHGRLEVSTRHSEFEGGETRVRFDARVKLPALQHRLSAFIGRDNEDDVARDRSEGLALRSQADELDQVEDWFAGLGYVLRETGIRSEFRVGVRGVGPSRVFAQLRNSYTAYEDDDDRIQLRATPFVNNIDGTGFTLSADFDHALSPTLLLRWGSVGTVTEKSDGVGWRSAVVLYRSLEELRAIALEFFERGATAAPEPLVEYGARVIYRQPLLKRRLFAELVPGYSWPRVDPALPREGSAGITFGLELPFGRRPLP